MLYCYLICVYLPYTHTHTQSKKSIEKVGKCVCVKWIKGKSDQMKEEKGNTMHKGPVK